MKFLFIDSFKIVKVFDLSFRPIVGDRVEYGYNPIPVVRGILILPDIDTLKEIADSSKIEESAIKDVEAIVYLDVYLD